MSARSFNLRLPPRVRRPHAILTSTPVAASTQLTLTPEGASTQLTLTPEGASAQLTLNFRLQAQLTYVRACTPLIPTYLRFSAGRYLANRPLCPAGQESTTIGGTAMAVPRPSPPP